MRRAGKGPIFGSISGRLRGKTRKDSVADCMVTEDTVVEADLVVADEKIEATEAEGPGEPGTESHGDGATATSNKKED